MYKTLGIIFIALILIVLLAGGLIYHYLYSPVQQPGSEHTVTILPGQSLQQIAADLNDEGIISNPFAFKLLARIKGKAQQIQAGEFSIHTSWSRMQLLNHLTSGQVKLHRLNIPEGKSWWQTADRVNNSDLADFQDFARAVQDKSLMQEYEIPAHNLEGYLYPETYKLPKPLFNPAEAIVRQMVNQFWKVAETEIWPEGLPDRETLHNTVIMASMLEKETARPEELRRIAGVFQNRLERGMLLQCDPTVIYGLGPEFDSILRRKELEDKDNQYNTYVHRGLPPGPICSPGLKALQAAKNPEEHSYLYFVAKGDGSHHFSKNLQEHNRAVHKYILSD